MHLSAYIYLYEYFMPNYYLWYWNKTGFSYGKPKQKVLYCSDKYSIQFHKYHERNFPGEGCHPVSSALFMLNIESWRRKTRRLWHDYTENLIRAPVLCTKLPNLISAVWYHWSDSGSNVTTQTYLCLCSFNHDGRGHGGGRNKD